MGIEEPSLNVILGRPPLSGAKGTPGKPSWLATLTLEFIWKRCELIRLYPRRNSFTRFGPNVCVSLMATLR